MSVARQLAASLPIRTAGGGAQIAIPILAVETTGDVALGAALVALALAPSIVAAPVVGAVLDGVRRPHVLMIAAAAATAATYAGAASLGALPTWIIALLLVISGLLNPFGFGGLSSFVAPGGTDARRAYALDAMSYNLSGVAGPAIVAVLAPLYGARVAMLALAAIALVSLVGYPLMPMEPRAGEREQGWFRSMLAGFSALATHRRVAVVAIAGAVTEFGRGVMPIAAIGIAVLAIGDASASAGIVAAFAVGALVGTLIVTLGRPRFSPQRSMIIGYVLTGLATLLASIDIGFWWTLALVAVSGLFTAAPTAAMLLLRRRDSPPEVVAQVFTVGAALRVAAAAGGTALAGVLAGLPPLVLLAASGSVWLVGAVIMWAYPRGTGTGTGTEAGTDADMGTGPRSA